MAALRRTAGHEAFWRELGARIRSRRRELGIRKRDMAVALGLTPKNGLRVISSIETARRAVDARELRVLCNTLGLPIVELLP